MYGSLIEVIDISEVNCHLISKRYSLWVSALHIFAGLKSESGNCSKRRISRLAMAGNFKRADNRYC